MSAKELIVDSWHNMLKNNFILKSVLVFLAYFAVYLAVVIVSSISLTINALFGFIIIIALLIMFIPIGICTTKVLLDTFQGRDVKVFEFVKYGFCNIKRMWAIIGRTILKMLALYIIKIALFVALVIYIASIIVNTFQENVQKINGIKSSFSEGYFIDDLDSLDTALNSLDTTLDSLSQSLDSYTSDTYSSSNFEKDLEDFSKGLSKGMLEGLSDGLTSTEGVSVLVTEFMKLFVKYAFAFLLFFIASLVIDILIVMKSLYYKYSYVLAFEDANLTSREAVNKSESLMKGNRAKYFWPLTLIVFLVYVVASILAELNSLIIALATLVIFFLLVIYCQSYHFTFFFKLIGKDNTQETSVAEAVPEANPITEEIKPFEETSALSEDLSNKE